MVKARDLGPGKEQGSGGQEDNDYEDFVARLGLAGVQGLHPAYQEFRGINWRFDNRYYDYGVPPPNFNPPKSLDEVSMK